MNNFTCPYCNSSIPTIKDTHICRTFSFDFSGFRAYDPDIPPDAIQVDSYRCPTCQEISIYVKGVGKKTSNIFIPVKPQSLARQFPNYIPQAILENHQEACAVVHLSPKASATLSCRCLQGMIRDFWGISKSRLIDEINALETKIPPTHWNVIDRLICPQDFVSSYCAGRILRLCLGTFLNLLSSYVPFWDTFSMHYTFSRYLSIVFFRKSTIFGCFFIDSVQHITYNRY